MKRAEGGFGNAGEGERMDLVDSRAVEGNAGEKRLFGPEEIDGAVGRRGTGRSGRGGWWLVCSGLESGSGGRYWVYFGLVLGEAYGRDVDLAA